jgi:peroxiredoxin
MRAYCILACGSLLLAMSAGTAAEETSKRPALTDPTILLIGDESVRTALQLTPEQVSALDTLLDKHQRVLLAIRDVGPTGADETAKPSLAEVRGELAKLLTAEQKARLQGIILQAQGYDALLRDDVATALKLTDAKKEKLASISDNFRTKSQKLQADSKNRTPEDLHTGLAKLQAARHKQIIAQFDADQQRIWSRLLGEPFDFTQLRTSPGKVPDFENIEAWLNSPPLTMESLRGQVVVVHFFAFGCINCIHNYPWYKEWQDSFDGKGVTIVGIHTPETHAEEDNEQLRLSLEKNGLKFPVAVDKEKKMWQLYYNNIWPAVYIIDKRGRLRYWWYGELDWQGAGNQANARRQIEQLLAEP